MPVILTVLLLIAYFFRDIWLTQVIDLFPDRIESIYWLNKVHIGLILTLGCWAILGLLDRFIWRGTMMQRTGKPVPRLLKDLVGVVIIALTAMALLVVVFDQSVLDVALLVGGFTLLLVIFFREMLQDMLAGIAINLDPSLSTGDVVTLPEGLTGRLTEITWRACTFVADDHSHIVVPNRLVSASTLINYSGNHTARQLDVTLVMDFSVSVERVVRILEGALGSLSAQGRILTEPPACAFASSPGTYGNEYVVRFYYDSTTDREEQARTAVVAEMMRHLQSSGLSPSLPKQNLFLGEVRMRNMDWLNPLHRESLLAGFSIFNSLESDELERLANSVILHEFSQGEVVIQQDDAGTSMYGLAEGYLEVEVKTEDEERLKVAELVPGQFFGEMSMLVGEPRAATVTAAVDSVVFEITRQAFTTIVDTRPETAHQISRVIAERQLANTRKLEASAAERESAIGEAADNLFSRMKSVFTSLKLS